MNKISEYEFVIMAIKKLRKPPYKGIHSVFSGFNQAFRDYFNKDPVEATTRMAQEGKIVTQFRKGGVMLYLPEEAPTLPKSILKTILEINEKKISEYEFIERAIIKLRKLPKFRGIHSVYSGFNQAFKEYFGKDPIEATKRLAKEGKLIIQPAKGGVMLFLPVDKPKSDVLDKILKDEKPKNQLEILGPADKGEDS